MVRKTIADTSTSVLVREKVINLVEACVQNDLGEDLGEICNRVASRYNTRLKAFEIQIL